MCRAKAPTSKRNRCSLTHITRAYAGTTRDRHGRTEDPHGMPTLIHTLVGVCVCMYVRTSELESEAMVNRNQTSTGGTDLLPRIFHVRVVPRSVTVEAKASEALVDVLLNPLESHLGYLYACHLSCALRLSPLSSLGLCPRPSSLSLFVSPSPSLSGLPPGAPCLLNWTLEHAARTADRGPLWSPIPLPLPRTAVRSSPLSAALSAALQVCGIFRDL